METNKIVVWFMPKLKNLLFRRIKVLLKVANSGIVLMVFLTFLIGDQVLAQEVVADEVNNLLCKDSNIVQHTLKNGLKILLKPTKYDKNEMFIQLISPNGYTKLCKDFFPSGALSAKVAFESGFGKYSSKELSYNLYKDSIDLFININKFYTIIDISFPTESLENALSLIDLVFKSEEFNSKALTKIIEKEKAQIAQYSLHPEKTLGNSCLALNTQNTKVFKPLTEKTINKIDLRKSSEAFRCFFSSPEDFTAVIVGDFDLTEVENQILDKLGSIEKRSSNITPLNLLSPSFPDGIVRKTISCEKVRDSYSIMTLPLKEKLTHRNLHILQLVTKLVEDHLQKIVSNQTGKNYGGDVSYELPLYPSLEQVWFNVQFQGEKNKLKDIEKDLIVELERLKSYEIDEAELSKLVVNQKKRTNFLKSNNTYWLSTIANFSLWGWDVSLIEKENNYYDEIKPSELRQFIDDNISTKNFTVVTVQP